MKKFILPTLLFFTYNTYSQSVDGLTGIIKEVKKAVLPIICHDSTWTKQVFQSATCVALGSLNKMCFLTCEHVVAIKDSTGKTKRYASDFYVQVNNANDSTFETLKVNLIYTDEKKDIALLAIAQNQKISAFPYIHSFKFNEWKETNELSEGQQVLYAGYPVILRRDVANHPIFKTSIIAQLISGKNSFLIDGFVQPKHSGSAVFTLQKDSTAPGRWNYLLVGIATSFPPEFGHLYENLNTDELQYKWNLLNPGYTNVVSMNEIIPVLKKFGFE